MSFRSPPVTFTAQQLPRGRRPAYDSRPSSLSKCSTASMRMRLSGSFPSSTGKWSLLRQSSLLFSPSKWAASHFFLSLTLVFFSLYPVFLSWSATIMPPLHRCFCTDSFHKLPDYSDSTIHRVPLHGHPEEIGCACDLSWPVLEAREKAVLERLQMEADLGMAKRLHHELNSSRFATDGDGVEGEGMKDGAWADERWKVGELDDAVWRE